MLPPSLTPGDRRGPLLSSDDVHWWHTESHTGFRIGLRSNGESPMGVESASVLICRPDGSEWINFGGYGFYMPGWTCGLYRDPSKWNNPLELSEDGEYLMLNWMFRHVHGDMAPVIFHIPSRTFDLIEPARILNAEKVSVVSDRPTVTCTETIWIRQAEAEYHKREFLVASPMSPIEGFYQLNPFKIEAEVCEWKEGRLVKTPLQDYLRNKEKSSGDQDDFTMPSPAWSRAL